MTKTKTAIRTSQVAAAALLASLAFVGAPASAQPIEIETARPLCIPDLVEIHVLRGIDTAVETSVDGVVAADRLVDSPVVKANHRFFRCGGGGGGGVPDQDGDGIPDSQDPDRDGDGYSNNQETAQGTNPSDPRSFPDNKWTVAECDAWEEEHGNGNGPEPCRGR